MSSVRQTPQGDQVTVTFPHDAQNLLVRRYGSEYLEVPLFQGMSALNLEKDLLKHLDEYPFTDEWLVELRDFVTAKLEARAMARKSGGFVVPIPKGRGFAIVNNFPLISGRVEGAA